MADKKIKVKVDVETNAANSIADLKALKKQLKETAAGSEDFKRLYNQIDDLEDKIKSSKNASADWIDTLESAGGPVGALGAGLNKLKVATQSFGGALKATGIGLAVAAVGGLVAAFSKSEEAVKKFQRLMIGLERILNGVLGALQPLIDGFIQLATDALPYVSKAFEVAYSSITATFQSLGQLGKAISKLIKGDFAGAWEEAKKSVTEFDDNFEKSQKRFIDGTKKMTKTEKEEWDKGKADRDKRKQERLDAIKEIQEGEKEGYLATLSLEEQEVFKANEKYQKLIYLATKYGQDTKALKEAQAKEVAAIEEKYRIAENERAEKARQEQIDWDVKFQQDANKAAEDAAAKKAEKDSQARVDAANLAYADYDLKKSLGEASWKDELDAFDKSKQLEREDMVAKKASADALLAFDKETAAARVQIEKAQQEAKLGIISDALGTLSQAVGENTAAGKALAVAQAVIDTYAGANKALAAYPPPFGAIAAGTVVVAGLLNVKKILSTKLPTPPGGKSSASSGGAPNISMPTVPTIQAPQVTTTGGNNPATQIGQTLANATKPIKAYVVSGDVSSQQALDRRTNRAATFSGG